MLSFISLSTNSLRKNFGLIAQAIMFLSNYTCFVELFLQVHPKLNEYHFGNQLNESADGGAFIIIVI